MRALLLVAACSSTPKQKPVDSATAPPAPPLETRSYSVPGRQLALEWNVTQREGDVALSLRIGTERIPIGAVMGRLDPVAQSYCDANLAKQHDALAKLTVGATTFLIKRPVKDRLELSRLGDPNAMATIAIAADAKVEEVIEDDDDRPGFKCR